MNHYFLIRRLRGPAFLILLGVVALLHKLGWVEHVWSYFWPLCLILWGVLLLAERAALHDEATEVMPNIGAAPYPGMSATAPPAEAADAVIVPAPPEHLQLPSQSDGGQS